MKLPSRNTLFVAGILLLVVSAGCVAFTDSSETGEDQAPDANRTQISPSEPTTTTVSPQTNTPESDDGTIDLRRIEIGEAGAFGELDQDDPNDGVVHYEPVTFNATAGTMVNISMSSHGIAAFKVVSPNGTVIAKDYTEDDPKGAIVSNLTLPETGEYTIKAMNGDSKVLPIKYDLSVVEHVPIHKRGWTRGNLTKWNRSEQLGEYAADYQLTANNSGPKIDLRPPEQIDSVNPEQDYIIVTYELSSSDPSRDELIAIDTTLITTYTNLNEGYRNRRDPAVNQSWIPERVYHRGITPDGELYRTTYIEKEWADSFNISEDSGIRYWLKYLSTEIDGPASPSYAEGAENSTTRLYYPGMNRSAERSPSYS